MRQYAILRLLLAAFFLYLAWPVFPEAATKLAMLFWGMWLVFFLLVTGANVSTLLRMTDPPLLEQEIGREQQTSND